MQQDFLVFVVSFTKSTNKNPRAEFLITLRLFLRHHELSPQSCTVFVSHSQGSIKKQWNSECPSGHVTVVHVHLRKIVTPKWEILSYKWFILLLTGNSISMFSNVQIPGTHLEPFLGRKTRRILQIQLCLSQIAILKGLRKRHQGVTGAWWPKKLNMVVMRVISVCTLVYIYIHTCSI